MHFECLLKAFHSALIHHVSRDATNGSRFNTLIHFDRPQKAEGGRCLNGGWGWGQKRLLLTWTVFTVLINLMFYSMWAGGLPYAPLLLLKVIKARRVRASLMDCPSADGHQFTRHVSLLSVTTTETVYKQLKKCKYIYCKIIIIYYIKKNQTNKIIDVICCGSFFSIRVGCIQFHGASKLFTAGLRVAKHWLPSSSVCRNRYKTVRNFYEDER